MIGQSALIAIIGFLVTLIVGFGAYWISWKDKSISVLSRRLEDIFTALDGKISTIKDDIATVSISFKLIDKDVATIKEERKSLEDMGFKLTKALTDVTAAHEKIRKIEADILVVRSRTHWSNNMLMRVNARLIKLHGAAGEVEFTELPKI